VLPKYDYTMCEQDKFLPLNSKLADYYVHIREGFIVPWSENANVITTNDILARNTDLIMLPSATDEQMKVDGANVNAAAVGYIYFDDGKSHNVAPSRIDFYISVTQHPPTITFQQTQAGASQMKTANTVLGKIYIDLASNSGLQVYNRATASMKDSSQT